MKDFPLNCLRITGTCRIHLVSLTLSFRQKLHSVQMVAMYDLVHEIIIDLPHCKSVLKQRNVVCASN